jgi:selenocysteine lyase/cysteine desulfurase
MLARTQGVSFDFAALRAEEFGRLDATGIAYLDFTASGLYAESQVRAHAERLLSGVYGNPHSEHLASRNSTEAIDAARDATLAFFDADPAVYDVCFTANTSAALKLVAESYPFASGRGLVLAADNHNSVNGMREYAGRAGAPLTVLPLDSELRLDEPSARLRAAVEANGPALVAFAQQSNFSGVRHDLALVGEAQALGCHVVIDAASVGPCGGLTVSQYPADFVACSFYKLFGLPTGVGALVARKDALAQLTRPWFAGGTVDYVSVAHRRHALQAGHGGFEDGTPNFLDLAAVETGFAFVKRIPEDALRAHVHGLTRTFLREVAALRYDDGAPLVRVYGPLDMEARGGTAAFNVLDRDGRTIPYQQVERRARDHGVAIRGGCFCNPGAAEAAFGLGSAEALRGLNELTGRFSVEAFQRCLGPDVAVGALRLSVGPPTNGRDIDRALALIASYAA